MKFGWFGVGTGVLGDLSGVIEGGREVERLGYESVWLGEHVVLVDPQASPSPLPPTAPMLDPIVVLAHLAASTTTLRLGIGVIVLPFRNALVLAKQLASLDVLSAGRLMVGIGVGGVPGEFSAVGVPFERRGRVADEAIDVLRAVEPPSARLCGRAHELLRRAVAPTAHPARGNSYPRLWHVVCRASSLCPTLRRLVRVSARSETNRRGARSPSGLLEACWSSSPRDHGHPAVALLLIGRRRSLCGPRCRSTGGHGGLCRPRPLA